MGHGDDHRKSTLAAMNRYFTKQARKDSPKPKRAPNKRPEKDLEKEVLVWLRDNGFSCHVIEAKATYNPKAGAYISAPVIKGMPDIVGCTPKGVACFIELKAPGRRSTLKPHQRNFLKTKITYGCFSVCVDSVAMLEKFYADFMVGVDLNSLLPSVRQGHEGTQSNGEGHDDDDW